MVNKKVDINNLFIGLQKQMLLKLTNNEQIIIHPTAKGDTTELNWIEWLTKYLPKRYTVDKGFVIDNEGSISQQIDLIIYDRQYCPFIFEQDEVKYIPAESVYAVFEVKPNLNAKHIKYACEKAESVRILKRTTTPIAGATGSITAKPLHNIICGLLTTKSSWEVKNEAKNLEKNLDCNINKRLDIICSINTNSYSIQYLQDKIDLETSVNNETLIFLFIKLFSALQKIGNPPAIDILSYAKAIKSI